MRQAGAIDDFRPRSLVRDARRIGGSPVIWLSPARLYAVVFRVHGVAFDRGRKLRRACNGGRLRGRDPAREVDTAGNDLPRRWVGVLLVTCGVMLVSY